MNPWLSVIVPTYDGAAYLAEALESIAVQRDANIEIVAIDDGSTDGTVDILRHYQSKLPIRIIERGRIGSWVANSDYAVREAAGEYVCFLHQDDFWYPERLAALRDRVRHAPDTVLWLHPVCYVDSHGRRLGQWTCPLPAREMRLSPEMVLEHLLVQNFVGMPAPLFRRDAFLATNGMDAQLWYVADWDLWMSLAERGTTAYLPQALAAFRIHAESQTVRRARDLEDLREQHWTAFSRHFPEWTCRDERLRGEVRAAFDVSTDLNIWLMGWMQGRATPLSHVRRRLIGLGPSGWRRLWRDSRIGERVMARVKCRWRGAY
jgi:glycosyltransferase involved in cell wall biosynthesis